MVNAEGKYKAPWRSDKLGSASPTNQACTHSIVEVMTPKIGDGHTDSVLVAPQALNPGGDDPNQNDAQLE